MSISLRRPKVALAVMAAVMAVSITPRATASPKLQKGTLVHTFDGDVQGTLDENTRQFLGIPYAAPPVGTLRWRPPQPVTPWPGVLQADTFPPACAQVSSLQGPASDVEDCLYLNVWTPDPAPSKPRPVMVWFPGGGNQNGSASDMVPFPGFTGRFYDGHVLAAEHQVVVVTINYRLNVFGFFAHSALAAEDPSYPFAGNQGLLDQRAALEWVHANILAFGGNPKKVTIFGESAGSEDVCFQVASPGTRPLFHRAISESGGCTTRQPSAAQGAAEAEAMSARVGCSGAADELTCLRQLPVSTLIAQLPQTTTEPVVDGGFLPDQPRTLFDTGNYAKVPYILGSNRDEGTLFFIGVPPVTTDAEYLTALQSRYGALADQVAAVYPAANFPTPQDALVRAFGDEILVCTTYDTARRAAAGGAHAYMYNFNRPIPIPVLQQLGLGAFHGSEIPYVFGSITPPTPIDGLIGETMRGYWTRFADSGKPNGGAKVKWPRFLDVTDERIQFDATTSILTHFRRPECEFWWSVYDSQFAGSPSGAFLNSPDF